MRNPYRRVLLESSLSIKTREDLKIELLSEHIPEFIGGLVNALSKVIQKVNGVKQAVDIYKKPNKRRDNYRMVEINGKMTKVLV